MTTTNYDEQLSDIRAMALILSASRPDVRTCLLQIESMRMQIERINNRIRNGAADVSISDLLTWEDGLKREIARFYTFARNIPAIATRSLFAGALSHA